MLRAQMGNLPGELELDGRMTGRRTLRFLARLGGHPPDELWVRRAVLCERLRLPPPDLRRPVRFQHDPELLVLDGPTTDLDPLAQG